MEMSSIKVTEVNDEANEKVGDANNIAEENIAIDSAKKQTEAINDVIGNQTSAKSKNFILNFLDFIKSSRFMRKCRNAGKRTGVPPKKIATNFFTHVLGTIGDILGTIVSSGKDIFITLVDALATVLKAGGSILFNVANAIVRIITLNKTVKGEF